MIYVIFEVMINEEHISEYLNLATKLKEDLQLNEGFVRSERFCSLVNERKLLSLSVWESEEAIDKWRKQIEHRKSQKQGRDYIFQNYTITVASEIRSYTNTDREKAPKDSNDIFGLRAPL